MKIILFSFNIFTVIDIRILPSFKQILKLHFFSVRKTHFPHGNQYIVNTFITAIIQTFFTNGTKIPNSVQVLIRMPTMNDKDLGKI